MCRSKKGELPTGRLPNPMILPPLVVVVLNQASIVNVPGAAIGACVATSPLLPLNVDALLASPLIAPVLSSYASTVISQGASTYWRLGESAGATAVDSVGFDDGRGARGVTRGATGAISGDANKASTFNGSSGLVATQAPIAAPGTFTIEAWFK